MKHTKKRTFTKLLVLCISLTFSSHAFAQDVDTMSTIIRYDGRDKFYETNEVFQGRVTPSGINAREFIEVEKILKASIAEYNKKQEMETKLANKENPGLQQEKVTIYLTDYRKQYVAVINDRNEKLVFVNCICFSADGKWKKEMAVMHDAGKCYFNVVINLHAHNYYNFFIEENQP
jgi:hypothetical protein